MPCDPAGAASASLFERPRRPASPDSQLGASRFADADDATGQLPRRGADGPAQRDPRPYPDRQMSAPSFAGADDATGQLPRRGADGPVQRSPGPRPMGAIDPILQRTADALAHGVTGPLPAVGGPIPQRDARGGPEPLPRRGEPLPARAGAAPGSANGSNANGGNAVAAGALPRRTGRSRPAGRHRSPHRLSVASNAPALVLAVPGSAADGHVRAVEEITAIAETSCPGVEIRVGFLDGDSFLLRDALNFDGPPAGDNALSAVVVPLLAGPHPVLDAAMARAADEAAGPVMLGAHLGGHPLIAEALHARLAEAGLAREGRSRGLSISTATYGVVVLADRGDEAVKSAGVAAVLLASRLAMPAAPASIDDPASVDRALTRLREAGAERPVISPCIVGPETPDGEIQAVSTALAAPAAAPLGNHTAVGQLVAIRYGAALAHLSMAG